MKVTRELIEHLAALARIDLPEERANSLMRDLAGIIEYFEQLNEIDTTGVEPLVSLHSFTGFVGRPDEPRDGLSTEDAMRLAPDKLDDYFKVPPVKD